MTCTAKLVFDREVFLSLSKMSGLLQAAAAQHGFEVVATSETLTGVTLDAAEGALALDLDMMNGETAVTLSFTPATSQPGEEDFRRLAGMTHMLLQNVPAPFVTWLDNPVRLPRAAFLSAFSDAAPTAAVTTVAPRRVAARPTASRARRAAAVERQDAHVQAYEAYLRSTLRRESTEDEINEMRLLSGVQSTEVRVSTWAMSLAVATISLPVAAPVLVHNLVKREDMRVASLAMGLAGLFVALDTTGAMAGIMTAL